ncbi:MAG: hypothetical protein FJ335_05230 [Sphingomonadales bacterium]|nr:hypothetical protein [Sphingomonadales bacterium]
MDDLGLGDLSDDQLIELARAVAEEIGRRDENVYAAARTAAAGTRPSAPRSSPRNDPAYDWSIAKRAAMMIADTLGDDWSFCVWKSDKGERRVYLDAPAAKASAARRVHRPQSVREGNVTVFVSGSPQNAPGTMRCQYLPDGADSRRIEAICRFLEEAWDHWPTTRVAKALDSPIPAAPTPPFYF